MQETAGLTRQEVISAYQLLLDRAPENDDVVSYWISRVPTIQRLRENLLSSEEYKSRNWEPQPSMSGLEPPIVAQLDTELSREEQVALFQVVKKTWTDLGEKDPFWAVMSHDEFHDAKNPAVIESFYESGASDVQKIIKTLERNDIDVDALHTVVEYGCGLGRVTGHLAKKFTNVIGIDISKTMLDAASARMQACGVSNASFRLLEAVENIDQLPSCDLFFSMIVLQHSPPPIISRAIRSAINSLNHGGVALFQVPTYIKNYRFQASEYVSGQTAQRFRPGHGKFEMHAVRQCDLFKLIHGAGGILLEVIEDTKLGPEWYPGSMSNTFLVKKL